MQQNHWADVARIFNLKLYERFTVIRPEDRKWDPACKYYFHDSGLAVILPNGEEENGLQEVFELINDESLVVLPQFIPTMDDEYWYIREDGLTCSCKRWANSTPDKVRVCTHNCFRNQKEAEANIESYHDKLNSYYKTICDIAYVNNKESDDGSDAKENMD